MGRFELAGGVEEHAVWRQMNRAVGLDKASPAGNSLEYAPTQMLNNAIAHSHGTSAEVAVWSSRDALTFRISDDGEGPSPTYAVGWAWRTTSSR